MDEGGLLVLCSIDNVSIVSSTASFVSATDDLLASGWTMVKPQALVYCTYRLIGGKQVKTRAIYMAMYYLPGNDKQGVRIEFNPNYIPVDEVIKRISFLTSRNDFRLSRLDIAFDLVNEHDLREFVFDLPRVKRNGFKSSSGHLETLYFGAPTSSKRLRVYDKKAERMSAGYSETQLADSWWRIEVQLRHAAACDWKHTVPTMLPVFTRMSDLPELYRLISIGMMSDADMSFLSKQKLRTWRSKICSAQTDLKDVLLSTFNDNVHRLDVQINTILDNFELESV